MGVVITTEEYNGNVEILSSKSELHRLLMLSALCVDGKETAIAFVGKPSKDVLATVDCMNIGGASIVQNGNVFYSTPINNRPLYPITVSCNESGSTLRFLLPVFSALGKKYTVLVNGRLSSRPLSPMYELLTENGVTLSQNGVYPLSVHGKFIGGDLSIDGSVSSQFITGLLMALPLTENGGSITVTGDFQSRPYVDITVGAMKAFGVDVQVVGNKYIVPKADYVCPGDINAGGDWSNAAFFLVAGAIGGKVTVKGLDKDSKQGDKAIVEILKAFGADVTFDENGLTVSKSDLIGIDVDAKDIPDMVPALCVLASVAKGTTRIYNAQRLRIKESDRIKSVVEMINNLGGEAVETEDGMIIHGRKHLLGGIVSSFNDHRIAMSAAVASVVCKGSVTIQGADAVSKSYPEFYEKIKEIGSNVKEI
ncbi:MAG: 3-phosphoshikimate 1-carboxyvinyltransferase [Clostridia bacterium]|nr:3-phosphoshikimate 1-carboxyvinyltransferase [Clostridia bacterium]